MSDEEYATTYHTPVLVEEVLEYLAVESGRCYVDATAGGGGHTEALLAASEPDGEVIAVDRDPEAVEQVRDRLGGDDRLTVERANYSELPEVLRRLGNPPVDGLLIDAGVSSHQLDEARRGFSLRREGPLDMRMGPEAPTVAEYLDDVDVDELAGVLGDFGEISGSHRLARVLLEARAEGELETTTDLADLVEDRRGTPPWKKSSIHPATLVFQALRIAVNRELEHLADAVELIPEVVAGGGRAVIISFHSLEDRIVKHGFRRLAEPCVCPPDLPRCGCGAESFGEVLTKGPVMASDDEVESNPRSRSAKLRAFRLFEDGGRPPN